ncbi:Retrovirus-related Pol polyprotein from transposon 17.6, partial [Mucuna pruriens]
MSIFSNLLEKCMKVFMDDFTVYGHSLDVCLEKLCIDTNHVLNFGKCHFMVIEGIVLGHLVSSRGIEVNKAKVDIIASLSCLASVREVCSFLGLVDKFRSHFLGSKIVIFSNHAALKILLKKPDMKGAKNLMADHLSRIERNPPSTYST